MQQEVSAISVLFTIGSITCIMAWLMIFHGM